MALRVARGRPLFFWEGRDMHETIVDSMAWRPLASFSDMQLAVLRDKLSPVPRQLVTPTGPPEPIELFQQDNERGLFGIPREFYRSNRTVEHPIIDRTSDGEAMGNFESKIVHTGKFAQQAQTVERLRAVLKSRPWGGTILEAGCGSGKTICALQLARLLGRRTIVLVNKEFLLDQWTEQIAKFMPDARVGIMQQGRCDVDSCDFVIGMLASLSARDYGESTLRSFGFLIADEVHRVGARTWAPVIPKFPARYRLGLSATVSRKDGMQRAFFDHIGSVGWKHEGESMVPELRELDSNFVPRAVLATDGRVRMPNQLTKNELEPQLAINDERNRLIADDVVEAAKAGRKVMVFARRLEQLQLICREMRELLRVDGREDVQIDAYTGSWFRDLDGTQTVKRTKDELEQAKRANIILATEQFVSEALDIPALDVLWIAAPISDVTQAIGRIQRYCEPEPAKCERLCAWRAGICEGKPIPIVVDLTDIKVSHSVATRAAREKIYKRLGIETCSHRGSAAREKPACRRTANLCK